MDYQTLEIKFPISAAGSVSQTQQLPEVYSLEFEILEFFCQLDLLE